MTPKTTLSAREELEEICTCIVDGREVWSDLDCCFDEIMEYIEENFVSRKKLQKILDNGIASKENVVATLLEIEKLLTKEQ